MQADTEILIVEDSPTQAEKLRSLGLTWMDIQMLTPVTESLGGTYVTRPQFLDKLDAEHAKNPPERLTFSS